MDSNTTSAKTYIPQLCANTVYYLEDLVKESQENEHDLMRTLKKKKKIMKM